jgi:diaminopimelate decarboxylase
MSILDIGGGFPAGELSKKTVEALKPTEQDELNFKVIAEPGRHFSSRCFYLLTRILGKRMKGGKPCYHINESLYHSFNCTLMDGVSFENSSDQFYSKIDERKEPSAIFETKNSTLFGMTCDGMDIITKSISIPIEAQVGDWLCFNGMGAYTHGCRSNFNGMTSTERIIRWPTVVHEEE